MIVISNRKNARTNDYLAKTEDIPSESGMGKPNKNKPLSIVGIETLVDIGFEIEIEKN